MDYSYDLIDSKCQKAFLCMIEQAIPFPYALTRNLSFLPHFEKQIKHDNLRLSLKY